MKDIFLKYFNKDIAYKDRLFNLACLLSSLISLSFILVGILFRIEKTVVIICLFIYIFCTVLFFFQQKWHKTLFNSLLLLVAGNFFGFPIAMVFSTKNSAEMVVYFLLGINLGLVLLEGKTRWIYSISLFVFDLFIIIYTFILRKPYDIYYAPLQVTDYIRLEFAVLSTGIMCGAIVLYRNHLIKEQINERETIGKQLKDLNFAQDMFLVTVSHEIRTPLNAIIGTTDMLLDSDVSNHIKEKAFNISNSSHALLSITSDLLDFSTMDPGTIKTSVDEYNLAIMLNDVINLMSVRLLEVNINLYVDINPNIPANLIGDSGKFRQILVNILSNAVKYTKEGYIFIKIDFRTLSDSEIELLIDVEDSGIGIKQDMLDKIFEPYIRSGVEKTDYTIEGTGLGLALCKKLVNSMNGNIWAESEYGKGSIFHLTVVQKIDNPYSGVYCGTINKKVGKVLIKINEDNELVKLPDILNKMEVSFDNTFSTEEFIKSILTNEYEYYIIDSNSYNTNKEIFKQHNINWTRFVVISSASNSFSDEPFDTVLSKPISSLNLSDLFNKSMSYSLRKQTYEGDFTIPKATILVVDDNLVNLEVASNMLQRYSCNVLTSNSGMDALTCLEQETVDLVFLDYMMPGMDGIDTLKAIRTLPTIKGKQPPVVALTANVVSGAREMFIDAGFDEYMAKPIKMELLSKVLLQMLPSELINFVHKDGDR